MKSYWEEHVFERDTARVLRYYKHVLPGSIQDGDEYNARYLVWKYRGKKEKLWRLLEKKYGEPVLEVHEYPDLDEASEEQEAEEQNLDETSNPETDSKEGVEDEEREQKDEPDL